jgi:3-hydroxyisobutyrate dehydrogenase-like beta-hydroxyacid dehydrogenase
MTMPVVGFVGLGAMGSRMAAKLLEAGHPLVAYNRTAARSRLLSDLGAEIVATPAEVADRADIVAGCLLDGAAVEEVYAGPNGVMGSSRAGQVFVEHGTFAPQLARRLATRLAERGAAFLDAPVTGGPEAAAAGTLTVMVGGDAPAVATVSEVLSAYAGRVCHVGLSGAGLELKLINQLLVSCHVAAAAEALALLQRLELPLDTAADVLNSGWAASAMLERGLNRVREDGLGESAATLGGLVEPQELVAALAAEAGVGLTVMPAVSELFRAACAGGLASQDLAALVHAVGTAAD